MSFSAMRYAHTDGISILKFTRDGRNLITAGADGDLRVFDGTSENEKNSFLVGDEVLALACDGSATEAKVYVAASNTNTLQEYFLGEDGAKNPRTISRFTADVSCVDVNEKSDLICAGSLDMTIKVINRETFKETIFEGHTAPVLSVAFSPNSEYIISSSCDGSVRMWDVVQQREMNSWTGLWPTSNDITSSVTRGGVAWNPKKGEMEFCFPLKDCLCVIAVEQGNNFAEKRFTPPSALEENELFSTSCWSNDGTCLVGATTKGKIFIWKKSDKTIVLTQQSTRQYEICSMAWHPTQTELAFIDMSGHWCVVTGINLAPSKTVNESTKKSSAGSTKRDPLVDAANEMLDDEQLAAALFEDDDDDENENSFSIRKIKKETGFAEDGRISPSSTIVSDVSKVGPTPQDVGRSTRPSTPVYEPDIQPPFQPGSTPAHLESRFMVYNSVGIVKGISDNYENSVDVEFHDSNLHHAIHITNSDSYNMADLSVEALVLAREALGDDEDDPDFSPSKLMCHYFGSSDLNKAWTIDMGKDEEILGVCCGDGWVAAATDRRNLRLYSVGGLQRQVIALPGPIVALAGNGPHIFVSVHSGLPLPGDQSISAAIFNVSTSTSLGHQNRHLLPTFQPIPLAPKSCLAWMGFTDERKPAIMDSAGFIRILNTKSLHWHQVCDSKSHAKGKKDHHFLVGISEKEFTARTIYVKGSHFPPTVPRPVMMELPLAFPLVGNPASEKTNLECDLMKSEFIMNCLKETEMIDHDAVSRQQDEALIKLFALACKTDHDSRAMEVCKLMNDSTLQLAIKYASKLRRMQLATKISEMACKRQEDEEALELEEQSRQVVFETNQTGRPSSRASVDLFASQREEDYDDESASEQRKVNPILDAKRRKMENPGSSYSTPQLSGTSSTSFRNPFKKTDPSMSGSPSIRPGLVFDEMPAQPTASKSSRNSFGSKKIEMPEKTDSKTKLVVRKKVDIGNLFQTGKENATSKNIKQGPLQEAPTLFGFQLWLAENRDEIVKEVGQDDEEAVRDSGLSKWKQMSREEKEDYKTPRTPVTRGAQSGKRKLESSENVTSKLAKFSALLD